MTASSLDQEAFDRFLELCSEPYLIRAANKGLYNRASKDLAKETDIRYEQDGDALGCQLSDGHRCLLRPELDACSCSCPSDKLCKHILIALLDCRQRLASGQQQRAYDFGWLLALPLAQIAGRCTEEEWEELAFRMSCKEELQVTEGPLLIVAMKRLNVEVSFTAEADVDKALCSSKEPDAHLYVLEALLRYRALYRVERLEETAARRGTADAPRQTLDDCRSVAVRLLQAGLARAPQGMEAQLEVLALTARAAKLPELEKELRGIRGELDLFQQRHFRFSAHSLKRRLTRMYAMCGALERELGAAQKQLVTGQFRSRYFRAACLPLYGLGALPWSTRSGHQGITYYFYNPEHGGICTYTQTRPVYYEQSRFEERQFYDGPAPWGAGTSMKRLSAAQFDLYRARVNRDGRLSASEDSRVSIGSRLPVEQLNVEPLLPDGGSGGGANSGTALGVQRTGGFIGLFERRRSMPNLVALKRIAQVEYERSAQRLVLTAETEQAEWMRLGIPYEPQRVRVLEAIERSQPLLELRDFYALVVRQEDGLLPISLLKHDAVTNLLLDF